MLYYYLRDGVGVVGYDPIQGALSPPFRVMVHLSGALMLWAAVLFGMWSSTIVSIPNACLQITLPIGRTTTLALHLSLALLQSGCVALLTYAYTCHALATYLPGVSQPAGPRPRRMQRQPQWKNAYHVDASLLTLDGDWRMVVGSEAHTVTLQRFGGPPETNRNSVDTSSATVTSSSSTTTTILTGEPAGRDIWTVAPRSDTATNVPVDETVVQEWAAGGRRPGHFNPALNPNR